MTTESTPSPVGRHIGDSALTRARRDRDLRELREISDGGGTVDLIVIGAGVTGAGIALDAASRGLDVVLAEAHDLAFGTSRWSSKLAHGGLRYLASGRVGIAHRSARERGIMLERTAPHLVHRLAQVVPLFRDTPLTGKVLPRLGFIAGDALRVAAGTKTSTLPFSSTVGPEKVAALSPTVRREGLLGGHVNHDGQLVDDARLVTALARTAAKHGARVLTHAPVTAADGTSATIRDGLGDAGELRLRARAVVNATGVWAGSLDPGIRVRPSRGTHIVVDAETLGNPEGSLTVAVPGHVNRFCFVLPAPHGRCYIGLTDEDAPGPVPDVPEVPEEDVEFLLDVVNRALGRKLTRDDVIGAFAGLRPLIDSGDGSTADLSREHAVITADDGLISIVGGKLTEYRLMAEQAVDAALDAMGGDKPACRTRDLPLVGAPGTAEGHGLPEQLAARHGAEAPDVVAECPLERPLEPVFPGSDVLRCEFAWAVTHEGACTTADILERRTRLALVPADAEAAADAAAEALALTDQEENR
ncbi:glycerol-3-phosphate dehydrogenase/oxidase [Corynebacterium sp. 335C]